MAPIKTFRRAADHRPVASLARSSHEEVPHRYQDGPTSNEPSGTVVWFRNEKKNGCKGAIFGGNKKIGTHLDVDNLFLSFFLEVHLDPK